MGENHMSPIKRLVQKIELQAWLFSSNLKRIDLINHHNQSNSNQNFLSKVNVWQNHSFESIQLLCKPFMDYCDYKIEFNISAYDDTLAFQDIMPADIELVWIDNTRYIPRMLIPEWLIWIETRIRDLRKKSKSPIVVATWFEDVESTKYFENLLTTMSDVYFANLASLCGSEDIPLIDYRTLALTGTSLSNRAQMLIAKNIVCRWIPGLNSPPIKALALDLDNTLYSGVLGEDGILGVDISKGYDELQLFIKDLHQNGMFITIVSKNELSDVQALFNERDDFSLRWKDFSAVEISWGDKGDALKRIAKSLRISEDSILFIDDNPGELATAIQKIPSIKFIHASNDPYITCNSIGYYPGLWRWKSDDTDKKRVEDLRANTAREEIFNSVSDDNEYFKTLKIVMSFQIDPLIKIGRLADLSIKTNQFNTSFKRYSETALQDIMNAEESWVIGVSLSDKLADSGLIAIMVVEHIDTKITVKELCISCRAMGRKLENSIIIGALKSIPIFNQCKEIIFEVAQGPRNQPALTWLATISGNDFFPNQNIYKISLQKIKSVHLSPQIEYLTINNKLDER
jgi:FkbH-like protein